MATGKLSQQRSTSVQSARSTRSQRVQQNQANKRARLKFERSQTEAQRLKTDVFVEKDVVSKQNYNIYRPKSYSANRWARLSDSGKSRAMRQFIKGRGQEWNFRKGNLVVDRVAQRDVTTKDPFTFQEYTGEYKNLSPDVKQFFQSPTEITTEKNRKIEVQRSIVDARLVSLNKKVSNKQDSLNDINSRDYSYSTNPETRKRQQESRKKDIKDKERDLQEAQAELRYLQGEAGKVDTGYLAGDLIGYAQDKSDYDRRRWDSKGRAISEFRSNLKSGNLDLDLSKIYKSGSQDKAGLEAIKKQLTYSKYQTKVAGFNKNVAINKGLTKWAEKVGYTNLSPENQKRINPQAVKFAEQYPNEVLSFNKSGGIESIQSEAFGETLSIANYNARIEKQQKRIAEVGIDQFTYEETLKEVPAENQRRKEERLLADQNKELLAEQNKELLAEQNKYKNIFDDTRDKIIAGEKYLFDVGKIGLKKLTSKYPDKVPTMNLNTGVYDLEDQTIPTSGAELLLLKGEQKTGAGKYLVDTASPIVKKLTSKHQVYDKVPTFEGYGDIKDGGVKFAGYEQPPMSGAEYSALNVFEGGKWLKERVHFEYAEQPLTIGKKSPTWDQDMNFIGYKRNIKIGSPFSYEKNEFPIMFGSPLNIKFGKSEVPTDFEQDHIEFREKATSEIRPQLINWGTGKEKVAKFDKEKRWKYDDVYQDAFIDAKLYDMIVNKTSFEEASSDFKQSDVAKDIQQQYSKEYAEDYRQLQLDAGFGFKQIVAGVGVVGIGLAVTGSKLTDNPVDVVATTGAVYGATATLGALPSAVKLGLSGAFVVGGTIKTFDPTATFTERGAGLTMAVISGASLGYSGVKYLRSAKVLPRVNIKPPRISVKASQTIGKNLQFNNKAIYGSQKVSQTVGKLGSRQPITTKGRFLTNKYLGTNFKNIYEGIPANQPAQYSRITNFATGQSSLIKTAPSGYENAFKLLKKSGFSTPQAKATLVYNAPRVYNLQLEKGLISVGTKSANAQFTLTQRQPVIEYTSDGVRVKTRGARVIQNKYTINREVLKVSNKNALIQENKIRIGSSLDSKGNVVKLKDFEFSQSKSIVHASDTKKGIEYLGKNKLGEDVFRSDAQYRNLISISKNDWSLKFTPKRTKTIVEAINKQTKGTFTKSTLYDWKAPNLLKEKLFTLSSSGERTPYLITGKDTGLKLMQGSGKIPKLSTSSYGSGKDMKKVIDKIVNPTKTTGKSLMFKPAKQKELFQLSSQELLKAQLKTVVAPQQIQITKVGSITAPTVATSSLSSLATGQELAIATQFGSKTKTRTDLALKNVLKSMNLTKTAQLTKLAQGTKTAQLQTFATTPISPTINILKGVTFTPTPTPTTPFVPPVIIAVSKKVQQKRRSGRNKLSPEMFGLLPDFTSRAIGLKPQEFGSAKDVIKEMKKLQTGFGIRRGARLKKVKKSSTVSEKNLLKGIMR